MLKRMALMVSVLTLLTAGNLFATYTAKVTSTPAGAEVWVDGEKSDFITPCEMQSEAGSYKIVLKARGYLDASGTLVVGNMKKNILNLTLELKVISMTKKNGMIKIEGGTFQMGDKDNGPIHSVTVTSFSISKYDIMQGEWKAVMGNNPSGCTGDLNCPVEQVSWNDSVDYCNKRSVKEGLTPCYSGTGNNIQCDWSANGYRLPTEAEWEYAARAGTTTTYYWGDDSSVIGKYAWTSGNSGCTTHTVGEKLPNGWGLYDMSGNVWQWCWDWYGDYPAGSQTDYRGAASGLYRVDRGGSWYYVASVASSAYRGGSDPSDRGSAVGFRVVRP
jgi:formylglycine-generating enzyme required for sulfatase activity